MCDSSEKGEGPHPQESVECKTEINDGNREDSEVISCEGVREDPQGGGSVESEDSSDGTVVTKVKYRTWQSTSSESWESGNVISRGEAEELENEALKRTAEEEEKGEGKTSKGASPRPESLILPRPLQQYEKKRSQSDGVAIDCYNNLSRVPSSKDSEFENIEETMLSKSMPYGVVRKKGELFEFVADDLQEKIRQSSPLPKTESSGLSSRTSSSRSIASISSGNSSAMGTSMASELSRSPSSQFPHSPIDIPPIDPMAVIELEMAAKHVADSVDLLMGNLKSNLHKMSAITVGCLDAYKKSVDTTCDSVDSSIKSMYALMAKCEELSNNMKPVYQQANQMYPFRSQGQLLKVTKRSTHKGHKGVNSYREHRGQSLQGTKDKPLEGTKGSTLSGNKGHLSIVECHVMEKKLKRDMDIRDIVNPVCENARIETSRDGRNQVATESVSEPSCVDKNSSRITRSGSFW